MPYSCVAQNIRIWSITATEPRFAQAAHIGGYRVSRDCGAVTAGNEAPVWQDGCPRGQSRLLPPGPRRRPATLRGHPRHASDAFCSCSLGLVARSLTARRPLRAIDSGPSRSGAGRRSASRLGSPAVSVASVALFIITPRILGSGRPRPPERPAQYVSSPPEARGYGTRCATHRGSSAVHTHRHLRQTSTCSGGQPSPRPGGITALWSRQVMIGSAHCTQLR